MREKVRKNIARDTVGFNAKFDLKECLFSSTCRKLLTPCKSRFLVDCVEMCTLNVDLNYLHEQKHIEGREIKYLLFQWE